MDSTTNQNELIEEVNALQSNSQVLLIRHACSAFNKVNRKLGKDGADELAFIQNGADPEMRDCQLADQGIEETKKAQKVANHLNVHTVFISPYTRTCQTAYNIFSSHPDFDKIKFVIMPLLREKFKFTCDIPSRTEDLLEKFGSKFPHFDTSFIQEPLEGDSEEDIKYKSIAKLIYNDLKCFERNTLKPEEDNYEYITELMTNKIQVNLPNTTESEEDVRRRCNKVKQYLAKYMMANNLVPEDGNIKSSSKVVLVAHNGFLVEYQEKDISKEVSGKSSIVNAKFMSDITDFSKI